MKKLITIPLGLMLMGLTHVVYAQTVNDVPIKEIDVDYLEIVGKPKAFSYKVKVELDFGQVNAYWNASDTRIKDADGNVVVFNSMVDALNFISKAGYELTEVYTRMVNENQEESHYILKRKKE